LRPRIVVDAVIVNDAFVTCGGAAKIIRKEKNEQN
jgi:hypothetical protein